MKIIKDINYFNFKEHSEVNGPGCRAVLWVQGCHLHCPGCYNRSSWGFIKAELATTSQLIKKIFGISGIEGVTFSGGEPLLQAEGLAEIAEELQRHGLSVMLYTGYEMDEIKGLADASIQRLLRYTDILITGRFKREIPADRPWIGSGNQEIHLLSERYAPLEQERKAGEAGRSFEVEIGRDGNVTATGFFPEELFTPASRTPRMAEKRGRE